MSSNTATQGSAPEYTTPPLSYCPVFPIAISNLPDPPDTTTSTEWMPPHPPRDPNSVRDNHSSAAVAGGSACTLEDTTSNTPKTSIESRLLTMQRLESFLQNTETSSISSHKPVDSNVNASRRRMAAKIDMFDKAFEDAAIRTPV